MRLLPWRRRKARSIPAPLIVDALKEAFRESRATLASEVPEPPRRAHLGWILSVPDGHQRTVLDALDGDPARRTLPCASEDDANAIAAGLWIGGEPCALSIQHAGLYASLNTMRGVALDDLHLTPRPPACADPRAPSYHPSHRVAGRSAARERIRR